MALTFHVYKDKSGEFRWTLKAANGEPIADSNEGYKQKASLLHAIDVIQKGAAEAKVNDETA
jgi:uncharacterized protein YegP (UPF0339 family)